jgi:ceramide glucosyltransferase
MSIVQPLIGCLGIASLFVAASYAVLALVAVLVWQIFSATPSAPQLPAVTVLMPLSGAQANLYERLRSFCRQNHPEYQIVFGVRYLTDPALPVVKRLIAEFPSLPIDVVVDPRQHARNFKIPDLITMLSRARHNVLAVSDSNMFVGPDYLANVTAPLLDQSVGLVTCICRGVPTQQICSRLSAIAINEWYVPSVLVAWLFGYDRYASRHNFCLRRHTLEAIGDPKASASYSTIDHPLGKLIRELGQRVVLSRRMYSMQRHELNLQSLVRHEVRWMRTVRALRPRSFRILFITFSVPLALIGVVLSAAQPSLSALAEALFQATVLARLALHFVNRLLGERPAVHEFWLLPVRDVLICWAWSRAFFTLGVNSAAATRALPCPPAATLPFRRE